MIGNREAKKYRAGFTLVEALVTMSIFTILVTSMCNIFVQSTSFGRSIILRAKLQADARNAIEAIARAVRVSNIDYAAYGGTLPSQPTNDLRLINTRTGDTVRVKLSTYNESHCYNDAKSSPCIDVSTDGGINWAPLSPRGAKIDQLSFYASPAQDPFLYDPATGMYASDNQPWVTIVAKFHGVGSLQSAEDWIYTLQTTVTPRLYLR